MKPRIARRLMLACALAAIGVAAWKCSHPAPPPAPTILSFRVGASFQEVVDASTYPVMEHAIAPSADGVYPGDIFVTEPAVILHFNDPRHGFILPPTKFALLGFEKHGLSTASTSPMLKALPFDQTVAILENLQNQFKAGGWEPWKGDNSKWFDLTPEGKKRLYAQMFGPGYAGEARLRVPYKYNMTFRIKCTHGCGPRQPPYLFLIDVGVGTDLHADMEDRSPTDPADLPGVSTPPGSRTAPYSNTARQTTE